MENSTDPVSFLVGYPFVLEDIFLLLSWPQLEQCRLVCHGWKTFIDESILGRNVHNRELQSRDVGQLWIKGPISIVDRTVGEIKLPHISFM